MTDNEIIKALECCSKAHGVRDCISLNCPLFDKERHLYLCIHGDTDLFGISLDLINRQKAEIEILKLNLDSAIKAITPCCLNCKHYKCNQLGDYGCFRKYESSGTSRCVNWEWRGIKEMVGDNNAE